MMLFAKVFLVGALSGACVLLIEQYILLTREPYRPACDPEEEARKDVYVADFEERLRQPPAPSQDVIPLGNEPLLEEYPIPKCFEEWWQGKARKGK